MIIIAIIYFYLIIGMGVGTPLGAILNDEAAVIVGLLLWPLCLLTFDNIYAKVFTWDSTFLNRGNIKNEIY